MKFAIAITFRKALQRLEGKDSGERSPDMDLKLTGFDAHDRPPSRPLFPFRQRNDLDIEGS